MEALEKKSRKQAEFSPDQVELIKRLVAKGASDDELKLFLYQAQRLGLDPLARQIYFQKRRNRKTGEESFTVLTAIDGYRLIADRTGLYAGNDDPVFDSEDHPRKATVTVYKLIGGIRCPFTATARWDQYYPGDFQGFMWTKMPHLMLGKCAEALALRKAFPAELSGVYVKEEMDQAAKESDLVGEREERALAARGRAVAMALAKAPAVPRAESAAAAAAAAAGRPVKSPSIYDDSDPVMQKRLANILKCQRVDELLWEAVGRTLHGRPSTDLKSVIDDVAHPH